MATRATPTTTKSAAIAGMSPAGGLSFQLEHVSFFPSGDPQPSSRFQNLLENEDDGGETTVELEVDDKDCILSQDFFCTPDYITPVGQEINHFDFNNKENMPCPKSPEKSINGRSKRHKGCSSNNSHSNIPACDQQFPEVQLDSCGHNYVAEAKSVQNGSQKKRSYVSQSAVALRCRVMPPPCIKNPYLSMTSSAILDIFDDRRSKSSGFSSSISADGLSRYRTDFHEIEQIGCGNFSRVFKVLKRIDGCMYAVKQSNRQMRNDVERRRALMEVQALSALGYHKNIVGYYTSWIEDEQLYIQMELCEQSLSIGKGHTFKSAEVLNILYQITKALDFMHEHGVAHLDVKPENIYVKNNVYKLGDFGCATLIDRSLNIDEGDSRYMPQEMFNENYEHLDKVDIFSLGAATYELVRGSPLPDSGPQFCNLREGKVPLLPGCPMQFQALLKAMMNPDPTRRPSAKELMEHPIFEKLSAKHPEQMNFQ